MKVPNHKISKKEIECAKENRDYAFFHRILTNAPDATKCFVLRKIGRLPSDFPFDVFRGLSNSNNEKIRLLAIKNLGKSRDETFMSVLTKIAREDPSSAIRRESVSSVGRIGGPQSVPVMLDLLNDTDGRIVVQAIRGLMRFRDDPKVRAALESIENNSNEVIAKAFQEMVQSSPRESGKGKNSPKQTLHNEFAQRFSNTLVCGDCLQVLAQVPDETLHLCFTSPPYYNARDYTIYKSYDGYLEFLTTIFREVHRTLQEGRFFVLNTSPVLIPRISRNHQSQRYLIPFDLHARITALGFDFVDDIIWEKPEPSAKNRNGGFFQQRKPLMYKANSVTEYVIVYRKRTRKLIDWNLRQYTKEIVERSKVRGNYEKSNAWHIPPSSSKLHPAIFPKELARNVIQFYSFVGDLVLDPFAGSGTVGTTATELERKFFLIEKEDKYCESFMHSSAGMFSILLNEEDFVRQASGLRAAST